MKIAIECSRDRSSFSTNLISARYAIISSILKTETQKQKQCVKSAQS